MRSQALESYFLACYKLKLHLSVHCWDEVKAKLAGHVMQTNAKNPCQIVVHILINTEHDCGPLLRLAYWNGLSPWGTCVMVFVERKKHEKICRLLYGAACGVFKTWRRWTQVIATATWSRSAARKNTVRCWCHSTGDGKWKFPGDVYANYGTTGIRVVTSVTGNVSIFPKMSIQITVLQGFVDTSGSNSTMADHGDRCTATTLKVGRVILLFR